MAELLIVDDEAFIRKGMETLFVGEGFSVRTARDGDEAVSLFLEKRPDLVLLDAMMEKANGFFACSEIRKIDRRVPIVFLTALETEASEVRALGCGADDYVLKSAGNEVLVARVRRALQRTSDFAATQADAALVRLGAIAVNLHRLTVSDGTTQLARLTRTEGDILRILASQRGCAFDADALITALRGEGFACEDNMIYAHIHNLRRKLGPAAAYVVSDRRAGYRLLD